MIFRKRYKDGYVTSRGLFYTKDSKQIRLDCYDDYHYEVKHKSFILSRDGVETMELIPKSPIEPHVGVLIDLFDNRLKRR
ncbi:MAG: hypothetical protein ACI8SE_001066 [Bacteroidia bacterium]|jgi:hypothetical protein